jgi:hypothetical protein
MNSINNIRRAVDVAELADVPVTLSHQDVRQLLDIIDLQAQKISSLREAIEDAQLIDNTYREAKVVKRELLELIKE